MSCNKYAQFIDYTIAFERSQYGRMVKALKSADIDPNDIHIITILLESEDYCEDGW